jgi:hypothetical protein
MSDHLVTVQHFGNSFEAQLAKNLLENEGITSVVMSGELSQDVLSGTGLNQITLQVHEDEAQRATGILAAVAAAKLDENWEEQAESGAGVWTCSICGEPVSNHLSVCYSCQTPREGIRAGTPRDRAAIQPDPASLPTGEEVQKRDEIAHTLSPAPTRPPTPEPAMSEQMEGDEIAPALPGDDLARRAFLTAWLGVVTLILMPVAWYYLLRAVMFEGERSPKGKRHLTGALLVHGFVALVVLFYCAGGFR